MHFSSAIVISLVLAVAPAFAARTTLLAVETLKHPSGKHIIRLKAGVSPKEFSKKFGSNVSRHWGSGFNGFAGMIL